MIILIDENKIKQYPYSTFQQLDVTYEKVDGKFHLYYDKNHQTYDLTLDSVFKVIQQQPITDLTKWLIAYHESIIQILFIDQSHYHDNIYGYLLDNQGLTVGESKSSIRFKNESFHDYQMQLDKDNQWIVSNCCYDDVGNYKSIHYQNGVGYSLLGISLVFINNQVYIQENDLLDIKLKPIENTLLAATPLTTVPRLTFHHLNKTYQPITLKQQLPTLPNVIMHISTPLWVTMGPMLIMGIATLLSSSIMAYQRYYQGYDLIDSLPSLILPATLILSTLLFQPFIRYFEKKRNIKEQAKRLDQFNYQFAQLCEMGYTHLAQLSNYIESYFPTSMHWIQTFDHAKINIYDYDSNQISISLGKSNVKSQFEIEGVNQFVEDQQIAKSLIDYANRIESLYTMLPFVIEANKRYAVLDIEDNLYKNILIQLISRYSSDQLQLVYIVDANFIAMHNELFILDYCYDHDNWLVLQPNQTLPNNNTKRKRIIFSMVALEESITDPIFYFELINAVVDGIFTMNSSGCCFFETDNKKIQIDMDDLSKMNLSNHLIKWFAKRNLNDDATNIFTLNGYEKFNLDNLLITYQTNELSNDLCACFALNENKPFSLDLSEEKDGPHGIIAGTTGSGKSELCLALIVSLLLKYSPTKLQVLIIDFKGSSLALALKQFPHFVGSIDNLSLHECERFIAALRKQSDERQQLFKKASIVSKSIIANIQSYRQFAASRKDFPQMAHLLIMIDEFAQVKKLANTFVDEIIQLARIGRSLGIHLIISSQKPSGIINDQIMANMHYKICLKVSERNDSMDVINAPNALQLSKPGSFYCLSNQGLLKGQAVYIKDYDDLNHLNHHGMIYDIMAQRRASYTQLSVTQSYLDTILDVMDQTSFKVEPLLNQAVDVYQNEPMDANAIEIGKYDDLQLVDQESSILNYPLDNVLIVGQGEVCQIIKSTLLAFIYKYHADQEVISIATVSDNLNSLFIPITQLDCVEEVLTACLYRKDSCWLMIEDYQSLLEEHQSLLQLIKKVKSKGNIFVCMFTTTISPYMYRLMGNYSNLYIDSLLETNLKSIFFPLVSKVCEAKQYFVYDINQHFIALNKYQDSDITFAPTSQYLSYQPLSLSKDCFAKELYTGIDIKDVPCVITTYNRALLHKIQVALQCLDYPLDNKVNDNAIMLIELEQFNDNNVLKTIYYDYPLYFVGPGNKQQYALPLQNYKEHDYTKAYRMYETKVTEVRWFDL